MGWVHAGFLWFMAGGSIPIIIHLLHRQKYRRIRWAAMEWLLAAIKKTRRRLQLENLILLLVRILIMILLALAIARPFLSGNAGAVLGGESDTHYILCIDNSYSMEYKKGQQSRLDLAKKASLEFLETLRTSKKDRFTLMVLSEYPDIRKREWNDLTQIRQAIEDVKISQFGSSMLAGMQELQKLLDRQNPDAPKNADRKVYFFTDMQRNGWEFPDDSTTARFSELCKGLSHLDGTQFFIIDVGAEEAPNHGIVGLRVTNKVLTVKRPAEIQVDLYNWSGQQVGGKRVQFLVDGQVHETRMATLPPGAPITLTFQYPFAEKDFGPHLFEARFDPQSEQYDYPSVDNHRFLGVDVKEGIRGLLIDGDPRDGKLLRRETGAMELVLSTAGYFKVNWITPHNFYDQKLEEYDFVALCNVKSLTPDVLAKIEEFVERGGGLFISLGSQIDSVWYNREIARCRGRILDEQGKPRRCQKCGSQTIRDEDVSSEKQKDPVTNKETTIYLHTGGRGLLPANLGEVIGTPPDLHSSGVPRRISKVNLEHKIFNLFSQVAKAQPYSLVFWKFFKLEGYDPSMMLAELDDSQHSPLMIEGKWGEGRVVLLGTAIDGDLEWNESITGRAPYFPIVIHMCEYLASRASTRRNFHVGELLQYYLPYDIQNKFQLYPPVGSPVSVIAERRSDEDRFMEVAHGLDLSLSLAESGRGKKGLLSTGKYSLVRHGAGPDDKPVVIFGVNVGPRDLQDANQLRFCEGNLEYLPKQELKRRYPEFKVDYLGEKSESGDEVKFTPPESELWKHLLFALLGFMVIEMILAALFGRKQQ